MGVSYQVVCYDCRVGLYVGKMSEELPSKHAELVKWFIKLHDGHRIGLVGDSGWSDGWYFPTDLELLEMFDIPVNCQNCLFLYTCENRRQSRQNGCKRIFYIP